MNNQGQLDISIKFDYKTGDYQFSIEEDGLPTQVPSHVVVGILDTVKTNILIDATVGKFD